MTIPSERYMAIVYAEKLLKDLLDPKVTPRVPKAIRGRAAHALRHYPLTYEMDIVSEKAPEVFSKWYQRSDDDPGRGRN